MKRDRKAYSKAYYQKNSDTIKAQSKAWREANREKHCERGRAWRKANPEKARANCKRGNEKKFRKKYGLSREQWNKIFDAQDRKCAICKRLKFPLPGPVTDHCHLAGHVRAILCQPCNTALGLFQHSPAIIAAALKYLSKELLFNHN
jgi:hypothetical protein